MPVKIKQNINININTKSKTKQKRQKTNNKKKVKQLQNVQSSNRDNYAYNPNTKTLPTSMPNFGGGGSVILNKSGYDLQPYSRFSDSNNSTQ